jgi:hypothetical protein
LAIPAFYIARDIYKCPTETIGMATLSTAWSMGLSSAFIGYVSATAKLAKLSPDATKLDFAAARS